MTHAIDYSDPYTPELLVESAGYEAFAPAFAQFMHDSGEVAHHALVSQPLHAARTLTLERDWSDLVDTSEIVLEIERKAQSARRRMGLVKLDDEYPLEIMAELHLACRREAIRLGADTLAETHDKLAAAWLDCADRLAWQAITARTRIARRKAQALARGCNSWVVLLRLLQPRLADCYRIGHKAETVAPSDLSQADIDRARHLERDGAAYHNPRACPEVSIELIRAMDAQAVTADGTSLILALRKRLRALPRIQAVRVVGDLESVAI